MWTDLGYQTGERMLGSKLRVREHPDEYVSFCTTWEVARGFKNTIFDMTSMGMVDVELEKICRELCGFRSKPSIAGHSQLKRLEALTIRYEVHISLLSSHGGGMEGVRHT